MRTGSADPGCLAPASECSEDLLYLYTAVTRGKRLVVLVGQKKAVAIAVRNVSGRRRWSISFSPTDLPDASIAYELTAGGRKFLYQLVDSAWLASSFWQARKEPPMIEFKARFFVLPAIALAVVAMLHGAADGGRSRPKRGATVRIADSAIRSSQMLRLASLGRSQSSPVRE